MSRRYENKSPNKLLHFVVNKMKKTHKNKTQTKTPSKTKIQMQEEAWTSDVLLWVIRIVLFSNGLKFPEPWMLTCQQGGAESRRMQQQVVCACMSWRAGLTQVSWEQAELTAPLCCHQAGRCLLSPHPMPTKFASVLSSLRINLFGDLSDGSVSVMVVFVLRLLPAKSAINSSEADRNNELCRDWAQRGS